MEAKSATKRVMRELQEMVRSDEATQSGSKFEWTDDNFDELEGEILGPPGTPYEGGKFKLNIKIPKLYPFKPPIVRFVTKIWHPNISFNNGAVYLVLKWTASMDIQIVLILIQVLLETPDVCGFYNEEAAIQFKNYSKVFELTARHWTNIYAGGPNKIEDFDNKKKEMMESAESKN